jgi:multiple sugar transport system substrate-binding protein
MEGQKRISRRNLLRLSGVAAGGALLAACGSTPTPQVVEKVVTQQVEKVVTQLVAGTPQIIKETVAVEKVVTATPPPPAPKGKVELQLWSPGTEEEWGPVLKKWNDAHPDVQCRYVFTPGSSSVGTNPKFLAATLGGNPPDVFHHDGSSYSTSVVINAFLQIDDLAQKDSITSDLYWDRFWPKVVWDKKLWGLPFTADDRCLYWNKTMFEEAGISEPPKTLDELDVLAEKLTKGDRQSGYKVLGFIPWIGNWYLPGWGWLFGAKMWEENGQKSLLNAPEMVEAKYADKYGIEEVASFSKSIAGETTDPFTTSNMAMELNGNWMLGSFAKYAPDLKYGMATPPAPAGKESLTWVSGWCCGLPRGGKHVPEAWELLKYVCGEEGQTIYCNVVATLPTYKTAADAFLKSHPEQDLFVKLLPTGPIEPVFPEWAQAWDLLVAAEEDVFYGRKTPEQALDDCNAKVQAAIDARLSGA